jgi:hypothetical protein
MHTWTPGRVTVSDSPHTPHLNEAKQLVKHMAEYDLLDPTEVWSVNYHDEWYWVSEYDVSEQPVDRFIDALTPTGDLALNVAFHREWMLGKWLMTGMQKHVSEAHKLFGEIHRDYLIGEVITYFANGMEEGDATN